MESEYSIHVSLKNCVDKNRLINMNQLSIEIILKKNLYFLVDGIDVKYTLLDDPIKLDTRKFIYVAEGHPNIEVEFGKMALVGNTITIDENIKNDYRNKVKEIELKEGRNLVVERIENIQNEIQRIEEIKLIVENIINNLNDDIIQDKNSHDNEQIMNKFRNELYTKHMLSNICTNINTYINWLEFSIDQVQKDTFYLNEKYFCYDVIENRIIKLPQNFDNNTLNCFDDVFSFRDYNEFSACKDVNNEIFTYKIANALFLCKSKNDGKWNVFPVAYEELGDIKNIEKDDIIKIIEFVNKLKYCGIITTKYVTHK